MGEGGDFVDKFVVFGELKAITELVAESGFGAAEGLGDRGVDTFGYGNGWFG